MALGTTRANVWRSPGRYRSPVRSSAVAPGEICGISASFVIGSETRVAPESMSPMKPIEVESCAARRAFAALATWSQRVPPPVSSR